MPKQKTHSGLKKRIKVRGKKGSLKLFYQKAARNHLLSNKNTDGDLSQIEISGKRKKAVLKLMPHA